MDTIKADKAELIETLKTNREEHRDIFLKAQDVYREQMIREFDRAAQEARDGLPIRRGFTLPVPEDHTSDFDTIIRAMEWHKGKTVRLTMREVQTYIENEWGWQQSFTASTASYLAG